MFVRVNGAIAAHRSQQNDTGPAHPLTAPTRRLAGVATAALLASAALTPAMAVQVNPQPDNPFDIGALTGGTSVANAVSGDGTTVVGSNSNGAFQYVWSSGTMTVIPNLGGGIGSVVNGVNWDGSVVVGTASVRPNAHAIRWTSATGTVDIDGVPNSSSAASAVNRDGTVIVGYRNDAIFEPFRWTQAGGMVGLGLINGMNFGRATAVSADGSVVAGYGNGPNGDIAFRWTQTDGMVALGVPNGTFNSDAYGISGDGRVIVGSVMDGNGDVYAVRWTGTSGAVSLGNLQDGGFTSDKEARAANNDGSVIVGTASRTNSTQGFRWTQTGGMVTVEQWLSDNGLAVGNNLTKTATGVSADGSVVVGQLQNDHAYIARGPVPVQVPGPGGANNPGTTTTTTAGLMDVTNYATSLAVSPRLAPQVQNADLVMNGAHSSPLFMLLDAGQSSASFTGDGGYTSARSAQGGIGAGEFGFGRGIEGGWTVRIAGGGQYARMDTPNAGNSVFSSGYVAPDVSYAVGGGVVATLSGYFNWGKADVRRGYLNGTANDSSFGSTATQTYGVRARVDWQDAFKLASTGVSPFVSYTYLNSQMNGYTETGGSFPVRFDGSREVSNAVRIGADATTPLNDQFALVTRFEYGHRFEKAGVGVSGQILGLSAFSIDGASVQQDWLRGGLGLSYKLGSGDGLVMVNTSNQTGKNTTWVSASYRVKF